MVGDFRPISLVSSLYKIVSKVLASRLRRVLGSTIAASQGAFVRDRQILDAVLVANEVVEDCRKRNKARMVFKIDFEKAYDHVEWSFLDEAMERKGFGGRWRKWISGCLQSVNFSVMINGRPRGKFVATRGLRQGDPISPFLFTLVVDVLSRIIEKAQEGGHFQGMVSGVEQVEVSHLQFADDTIFFMQNNTEHWNNLLMILDLFCDASGMKINKSKCSLLGINIDHATLIGRARSWGCEVGEWPMVYLGMPLGGNPRSATFWEPVLEKVRNRLQKWNRSCLSKGGRFTLIQAVLLSIPTYYLSLFRVPKGVAGEIERMIRNFLWDGVGEGKKDHLVRWEEVRKAKDQGGLGVGSVINRSEALRAKWLWRFPSESGALWHKVIRSIYGLGVNGWDAKGGAGGSCRSPWKDISSGLNRFSQGCVFDVGNGTRVRFWEDEWHHGGILKEMFPRLFRLSAKNNMNISSFVSGEARSTSWNFGFRRNLNDLESLEVATMLELLEGTRVPSPREDKRKWKFHSSGVFSCKSYCQRLLEAQEGEGFPPYNQIWLAKTPMKVKLFVWQAVLGKICTADILQRRRPYLSISPHWCVLCKGAGESADHVLLHCPFSLKLWGLLLLEGKLRWATPRGCFQLFSTKFVAFGRGKKANILWGILMQAVIWNLWLERNRRVFEDYNGVGVLELWERVKFWAALWASMSTAFKEIPYPEIMRNLEAAVL